MLLGVPNVVQVRPLLLNYDYRWKSTAAFVQHDWKVRPNLTLNLGLRYQLQYPRTEKNNLQGSFRPDLAQTVTLTDAQRRATATGLGVATNAADSVNCSDHGVRFRLLLLQDAEEDLVILTPVDYLGFEPRFGFAWSPKLFKWAEDRGLVIRGGYGISHATLTGNNRLPNPDFGAFTGVSTTANGSTVGGTADSTQPVRLTGNPPFISGGSIDATLGTNADGLVFLNSLGTPGFVIDAEGSGKVPTSQNWNLSIQFEPWKNTVVEVCLRRQQGYASLHAARKHQSEGHQFRRVTRGAEHEC